MNITDVSSKYGKIFVSSRYNDKKRLDILENQEWYFYCDKLDSIHLSKIKPFCKVLPHSSGLMKVWCENHNLNKWDLEAGKVDNKSIVIKYLLKHGIKTYEADFSPEKRWMIDRGIGIEPNPVIGFFDIETDDSKNGIEIGRDQILSFACSISGKQYFYTNKDERKVLLKIKEYFKFVDITCTWNGTNFDIPYVLARMGFHGIKFWKSDFIHFDLMEIFKKRYKYSDQDPLTNFNLEYICQLFLGKGKVKHSESIKWLFDNDLKKLETYNKEDVNLLHELNQKLGIMELIIGICVESGTPFRDYYISEIIDRYVLKEAKSLGRILPSNMWKLENREGASEKQKFEGGKVFDITPGLYENVTVLDFNSHYPNIIISWNIGVDTFLGKDIPTPSIPHTRTPSNCFFRKDLKSINAIVAEKILKERQDIKNQMKGLDKSSVEYKVLNNKSEIRKVLGNSQFGSVGSEFTRFYSLECSEAITLTAQYLLNFTNRVLTQNNIQIIAGDTDSVFTKGFKL